MTALQRFLLSPYVSQADTAFYGPSFMHATHVVPIFAINMRRVRARSSLGFRDHVATRSLGGGGRRVGFRRVARRRRRYDTGRGRFFVVIDRVHYHVVGKKMEEMDVTTLFVRDTS